MVQDRAARDRGLLLLAGMPVLAAFFFFASSEASFWLLAGLAGILFVLWILAIPLGIALLLKKIPAEGYGDPRSGNGEGGAIPEGVAGWNWGAFGLPVIWGMYHGVWISLLTFIPLIGFAVSIYLGAKGNEFAWQRNRSLSVEDFRRRQRAWGTAGLIAFILSLVLAAGQGYRAQRAASVPSRQENVRSTFEAAP